MATVGAAPARVAPRRSLRDILYVVFRHGWLVVGCVAAALLLLLALTYPPLYRSHAQLLLTAAVADSGPAVADAAAVEISILTSPAVLEQAVTALDGELPLAARSAAAQALGRALTIDVRADSRLIDVTLAASDPQRAQRGLVALIAAYQRQRQRLYGPEPALTSLLAEQRRLRERADADRAALEAYSDGGEPDEQARRLAEQRSALDAERASVAAQIDGAQARIARLEQNLEGRTGRPGISDVDLADAVKLSADLLRQRVELQQEASRLSSLYADDSPLLVDVRRRIDVVDDALAEIRATADAAPLALALQAERSELSGLNARAAALERRSAALARERAELEQRRRRWQALRRTARQSEAEYLRYTDKLQTSNVSARLNAAAAAGVALVRPATAAVPPRSSRPLFALLLAGAAAAAGLGIGALLALLIERFDETLKNRTDVEQKLGVPVLAAFTAQELKQCI